VILIPGLPRYASAGIDNPLGARALYLYQGGRDTLFRIHGTNEPWKIGQAASSGCIRMLNEDVGRPLPTRADWRDGAREAERALSRLRLLARLPRAHRHAP
jgi:hypothetical protein